MCMHGIGAIVERMSHLFSDRVVCALTVLAMGACTTFGGADGADAPHGDSGVSAPTDGQVLRDGAGDAEARDVGADGGAACRPPRAALDATFDWEAPVTNAVAALAPDGAVLVVGRASCGDSGRQMALFRVVAASAPVMLGCFGDDLELAVGIDVDATGIAIASHYAATGYLGARLRRLSLSGQVREPLVQQVSPTGSVLPTAVRRVAGRDVWAFYTAPSSGIPEGSVRVEGGGRTTSVGPNAVVAFAGVGASLDSLLVPIPPTDPPLNEISVSRRTLVGEVLVADANFGPAGKVVIGATSPNPIQYNGASLYASPDAILVGIPQQATATARFLKTAPPKLEHTVGPVGAGVGQVAVTMTCDGSVVLGHAKGQTGRLSRFGATGTSPAADPTWGLDLPRPPKALLTRANDVFVVYEDAGKTRIVRLDR